MNRRDADAAYDLIVIGGGTAGLVGAKTAAGLRARVLLVERDRPGGDCLWTGCVPSKALIAAAGLGGARHDFSEAMAHVRRAIRTIEPVDSFAALQAAGVETLTGEATFIDPRTVRVDDATIRFRQALIATGAAPGVPDIPGLSAVGYQTSETIWDLAVLPERLVILGGGPIGCELGQAFAHLGSRVTIVTRAETILPREDPAAIRFVADALLADGIDVRARVAVAAAHPASSGADRSGTLRLADGGELPFDALLVASGRTPRTSRLGLAAAHVVTDGEGHVMVDRQLRTTNPRIRAAGDVTSRAHHTHTAGVHGSIAASNAVLGLRRSVARGGAPRVTFTSPELAAVGASTDDAKVPAGARVLTWNHDDLDRAVTANDTHGETRLLVDRRGRILGATIVSPRAGETLGEIALAIHHGLRTRDLAAVTHPYPTFNDAVWNAAIADVRRSLASGPASRLIGLLRRGRRVWIAARQRRRR